MTEIPMWKGSLQEWRRQMGITQEQAAKEFECGIRRIQGIEARAPGYQLSRSNRIHMAVVLGEPVCARCKSKDHHVSDCDEEAA